MDDRHKPLEQLIDKEEVLAIFNDITIFAGLTKNQFDHLFGLLQVVNYEDDEIVFEQGSEPSYIYVIEKGHIKLAVTDGQTPLELMQLKTGDCFGETAVIGIQPHSASAVAEGEVRLIVLSRQALLNLYQTDLELYSLLILNIAREACRRLNQTDQILLHYVLDRPQT